MACAAYDLAGIYMAQGRVYGVQHVRGHDPGPGDHGTLSARTNPPGGSGFGGKLRHPPSHLTEAILRAMDWHQQAASLWRCTHYLLKSQHRSTNNLELLRCLHYANRRSVEWRQAPLT